MTDTISDLQKMELNVETAHAAMLLPLLEAENWALKAKAFTTLGRLANPETADALIAFMKAEAEPHWQLMALDSWYQLPLDRKKQAQTLQELLLNAKSPILIRGIISLFAYIGGKEVLLLLADFIDKPSHRLVKDEILAFSWFKITDALDDAFVQEVIRERLNVRVWLNYQSCDEKAVYGIYPNPDYLWQCAKKAGIEREVFKNLYWRPRAKTISHSQV